MGGLMFQVELETTRGRIMLDVHEDWSPEGALHFRQLVEAGFYDGAPWFRVIEGFVAQCGLSSDPALNAQWHDRTIPDEPVVMGNQRGYVTYGMSSLPNSRSTHFYINYGDNSFLDDKGFAAFAVVSSGMDVAEQLAQVEYHDQGGLAGPGGIERFRSAHPDADYILSARVIEQERG
jgi:cyclophilin family peptidyl-prolyl cis-trans isomerase